MNNSFFFRKALCVVSFLFLTPLSNAYENMATAATHLLTVSNNPDYYGTALLWKVTPTRVFFITNSHVVPQKINGTEKWLLSGPITKKIPVDVSLVAQAPGFDIAIISILNTSVPAEQIEGFNIEISNLYLSSTLSKAPRIAGIIGYESGPLSKGIRVLPYGWQISVYDPRPDINKITNSGSNLFTETNCPQIFIEKCYRVDIMSWGFSGNAYFVGVEPNPTTQHRIAGIVSHYSPISQDTYVIPTKIALETADRLLEKARISERTNSVYIETDDPSGTFRYIDSNHIQVLKGYLANKIITGKTSALGGGGYSLPGGGYTLPGGGYPPQGGNDAENYFGLPPIAQKIFQDNPLVFRGVNSLLSMRPGIVSESEVYFSIENEKGLTSFDYLPDFLRTYRVNPLQGSLTKKFISKHLPKYSATNRFGLIATTLVPELKSLKIDMNYTTIAGLKGSLNLLENPNRPKITFGSPSTNDGLILKLDGPISQISPASFRFEGQIEMSAYGVNAIVFYGGEIPAKKVYGVVLVEYDSILDEYMLKAVVSRASDDREGLNLVALSLPLKTIE